MSLLLFTAQQHDWQNATTIAKLLKRCIYEYEICDVVYCSGEVPSNTKECDIDYPIEPMKVHTTIFNHGPRLIADLWHSFPEDAQKIWDKLS